MTEETYNGWSNYPTWCINMWMSNDEPLYNEAREAVRLVCERVTEGDEFGDVASLRRFEVAEGFKRWVEDILCPDFGYALDEVDWYEIADAWLADVEVEA